MAAAMRVALVVAMVAVVAGGAAAQTSTDGCTQTLLTLSPCLNYLTGNETTPSASCCSKLGDVVKSQPECLCVALSADTASLGLSINRTRALDLPNQCNVKTPAVSNCKGAASPTSSPSAPGTPAGTGSKATPNVGSGVAPVRVSPASLVAGIVVAVVYAVAGV